MKDPTTDEEWADYLADVLSRLDRLAERPPTKDRPGLKTVVEEAQEPLGVLIGYLIG
jgi:hypothetical protein